MVGHYPTNKLIGRGFIPYRRNFPPPQMPAVVVSGIRPSFPGLSQSTGQITHVLLTRSPLIPGRNRFSVRLACVKHAASVRPEPGSNSPTMSSSSIETTLNQSISKETPTRGFHISSTGLVH
ncbi:conserved hypothetical protein [Streptomyces sp. AA4]|nr:conserved hypothetical protein [Streptomyces sp. AA4]